MNHVNHPISRLTTALAICLMTLGAASVQAAPLIIAQPTTKCAFVGDASVTFQVLATGDPTLSYQWQVQAGGSGSPSNVSGATQATLTLNNPSLAMNGNKYRCVVTCTGASAGTVNSNAVTLAVYPTPTVTPSVSLSSTTITANSTTPVSIHITGLAANDTVRIQRFLDANGNGTADIGEPLVQSFSVTDGLVSSIGGVVNTNVPGDDDGAADGQITTHFSLPASPEMARTAGTYIIRVSSPSGEFRPVNTTFTITQPSYGQSVSGQVLAGGAPVPYAGVGMLASNGDYVTSAVADASGNYTIGAPAGSYALLAIQTGYVGTMASAPSFTLAAGQTLTGQNPTLTPATCAIAGQTQDISGSPGLKGIQLFCQSATGYVTLAFSDSNGNYDAAAVADQWQVDASGLSLAQMGYVAPQNRPAITTTADNMSSLNLPFAPANALVYGTVENGSGTALPGVNISANDNNQTYQASATTDASGSYVLGITTAAADGWWVGPQQSDNPVLAGYIAPGGQDFTPAAGSALQVNFTAQQVTAHLQGTVTENGVAVSGATIGAYLQNSNNTWISTTTDGNGNFDIGVTAGTWNVQLDSGYQDSNNLLAPSLTEAVSNNQTISGIAFQVLAATGTISGIVKDANGNAVAQTNVVANATVNGVNYSANANTDSNGNYSLPVVNGNWTVGASVSGNYIQQTVTVSGSAQVNLEPPAVVAHLQGTVTKNGVAVSGATIGASPLQDPNAWVSTTTDSSGNFDIGVTSNGIWNVGLDGGYADSNNLVSPILQETVSNSQTISGIAFQVLAATGTISGTVKDENGNAVAQAFVSANAIINGINYNANISADGNGNYSLPVVNGNWTVGASVSGNYIQQTVTVSGSAQVNLAPPPVVAHLRGTMTNNGMTVPGATIGASLQDSDNTWISTTTDSSGNFDIGLTSIGIWNLQLDSSYADSNSLVSPTLQETVSNSQTISGIAFHVLAATGTISGTVKDASDNAVALAFVSANATINGINYNANISADSNGNYSLPVINGTWTVGASVSGNYIQQTVTVSGSAQVNLAPPAVVAHLQGMVTNNGVAVAHASVTATLTGVGYPISAVADASGYFDIGVTSDGIWQINLSSDYAATNNLIGPALNETVSNDQNVTGITLQVVSGTGTISGSVKDASGNPVTQTGVYANATINGVSYSANASTDDNGNYSFPVTNGTWTVGVALFTYSPQTVAVSGSAQINFTPTPVVAHLQGTMTEYGVPLGNVGITATLLGVGNPITTVTDGNGNFDIGVTSNGHWGINVSFDYANANNLVGPTLQETVSNNQTISGIAYQVVNATGTISGSVKDSGGNPVSHTNVFANANIGNTIYFAAANTDTSGNYSFPVINGTWTVGVALSGYDSQTATVSGSAQLNFALPPAPFQAWQQSYFSSGQLAKPDVSGPTALVPSGAGFPNQLAYALGVNPNTAQPTVLPALGKASVSGADYLALGFTRNTTATDLTYTVQYSSDLTNPNGWSSLCTFSGGAWSPSDQVTETAGGANLNNVQVRDTVPIGTGNSRFLRLVVNR